jgi:WD40 repeat protein
MPLRPASPEVVFAPTGPLLAAYHPVPDVYGNDKGQPLLLWDSVTGRPVADLNERGDTLRSVAFSPDARSLAAVAGGEVCEWDLWGGVGTRRRAYPLPEDEQADSWAAYGPRGRLVVIGRPRRGRVIVDLRSGESIVNVVPPTDSDFLQVVTGSVMRSASDSTVYFYDLATGSPLDEVPLYDGAPWDMSYAPAPGVLARVTPAASPCEVLLWERTTGRTRTFLAGGKYARPTVSADGRRLAVSVDAPAVKRPAWLDQLRSWIGLKTANGRPSELRIYEVETGREQARFPGGTKGYFSPDGRSLAVVSNEIEVYDVPFRPPLVAIAGLAVGVGTVVYLLAGVRFFRRKPA